VRMRTPNEGLKSYASEAMIVHMRRRHLRSRTVLPAAAVLILGCVGLLPALPAAATTAAPAAPALTAPPWWVISDWNTGLCLDDSAQYGVRGYVCNEPSYNSGYQAWKDLEPLKGVHWYQNENTGLCLDDSPQYGLRGYVCNQASYNSGYQQWIDISPDGPNNQEAQLENGYTAQCLDDSSQYGLRMYPCNTPSYDSGYQEWDLLGTWQTGADHASQQMRWLAPIIHEARPDAVPLDGFADPLLTCPRVAEPVEDGDRGQPGFARLAGATKGDEGAAEAAQDVGLNYVLPCRVLVGRKRPLVVLYRVLVTTKVQVDLADRALRHAFPVPVAGLLLDRERLRQVIQGFVMTFQAQRAFRLVGRDGPGGDAEVPQQPGEHVGGA
jgi:hypothetical protein